MALSNAERQARHRERMKAKLAAVAETPLRNDGRTEKLAKEIESLKRRLEKAEGKIAEKEAQRAAQESRANLAARQVSDATNRAMFAEADKERLAEEVERLRNGAGYEDGLKKAEEMLLAEYYGVAETWLHYLGTDEDHPAHRHRVEAHNAFLEDDVGFLDVMMMVQHEAFSRLTDYFSCSCTNNGLPEQGIDEPKWRKHARTLAERVT